MTPVAMLQLDESRFARLVVIRLTPEAVFAVSFVLIFV
jgi:hypothetical protein